VGERKLVNAYVLSSTTCCWVHAMQTTQENVVSLHVLMIDQGQNTGGKCKLPPMPISDDVCLNDA
jgi:hypothetical protein